MIENGYISYKISSDNVIDENGNPVLGVETWSELVPANVEGVNKRFYDKEKGNRYTSATYSIILSKIDFSDKIKVFDRDKQELGEYNVIESQRLDILGLVRITV